jgi:TPR repeat protein
VWIRKSAEQGNTDAQWKLGGCYLLGTGIAENKFEGVMWLNKSAVQGNENAIKALKILGIDIVK